MLAIRLARFGKKKQPTYRIIVLEKTKDNFGDYLENLGYYNPRTKVCELNKDRILHWISQGAKPTPTVHNLLVDQNVIQAKKVKASTAKKKKSEKKEEKPKEKKEEDKTEEDKSEQPDKEKTENKTEAEVEKNKKATTTETQKTAENTEDTKEAEKPAK